MTTARQEFSLEEEVLNAMERILNYMYKDERTDYESYDESPYAQKDHIFNDLRVLELYLISRNRLEEKDCNE